MSVVEVAHLGAVSKSHPIALPLKTVGQDHSTLAAGRHLGQIHRGDHGVADSQVNLSLVRLGQGVRFPKRHVLSMALVAFLSHAVHR